MRTALVRVASAALLTCLLAGPAAAEAQATGVGPWDPAPLLKAIRSARSVEAFLLNGGLVPDSIPNIGRYRIVSACRAPDSTAIAALVVAVRSASRDTCGFPMACTFDPRCALRFHDQEQPLDILISFDCEVWQFQRGLRPVAGYSPWSHCVRTTLEAVVAQLCKDVGGVR